MRAEPMIKSCPSVKPERTVTQSYETKTPEVTTQCAAAEKIISVLYESVAEATGGANMKPPSLQLALMANNQR